MKKAFCILGLEHFDLLAARARLRAGYDLFLVGRDSASIDPAFLHHPQVHFFAAESPILQKITLEKIAWQTVLLPCKIQAEDGWRDAAAALEEVRHGVHLLLSEASDFGQTAFFHARANWQNQIFRQFAGLSGCMQDVPAIVCGAGPSLEKAIPLLGGLETRALIIAAGTAATILSGRFHLSCQIDKEKPLHLSTAFSSPCCIQSRLHPDAAREIHGEKILALDSGILSYEKWWLGMESSPEFGWTVGNFATEAAVYMGCNPIIWAGMDFCYNGRKKYAVGLKHKKSSLISWKGRTTQSDWQWAVRWSENLARENPKIRFINTSEGIEFEEPVEKAELSKIALSKEFDLSGRLHQAIQGSAVIAIDYKKKEAEWAKSAARCLALCDLQAASPEELENEIVYTAYLEPLWRIFQPLLTREAADQNLDWHRLLFFQNVLQTVKL